MSPHDVGLRQTPSLRRVAGLRREEVALLAGISSDYYLRLEQGRELHPSSAVLTGLTRALALDRNAAAHLHRLARPPLIGMPRPDEPVSASLLGLIASLPSIPAHVVTRYLDIIHVNRLARLLSPGFRVGNNLVELLFHPAVPRDAAWHTTAVRAVAYLRSSVEPHDEGPRITQLLEGLHAMDPEFTRLWRRHDTGTPSGHPSTFRHPAVGSLELRYQTFDLPGTGGQSLGMYIPAPGSASAEKLAMLSLLADDPDRLGDRVTPRETGDTHET